jgi:hypothetical protein
MKPFFIGGFQRSGTTLLRLMLDNHPQIAIPLDTTDLWFSYSYRLGRYNDLKSDTDLRTMVGDLLEEERIKLWNIPIEANQVIDQVNSLHFSSVIAAFYKCYAQAKGKLYWGDKNPGNLSRMDLLNQWFPDCQFVHIIRDGRDACLSHLEQTFGHDDMLACACDWREEVQWVRRMGRLIGPARYAELRYEDLVTSPETELLRLSEFLHIDYHPDMMKYHEHVNSSIPASKLHIWPKIVKPPLADNINRWKGRMPRGLQLCFEKRAGSILRDLGYDVSPGPWSGGYCQEVLTIARRAWRAIREKVPLNGRARNAESSPSVGGRP